MQKIVILVLVLFGIGVVEAQNSSTPLKVFVMGGQSNMVGKRSVATELPAELQGAQKNLFFKNGQWVALKPKGLQSKGFGPEISFAAKMSSVLNEPVGIIKFASGGTNLAEQWSPVKQEPAEDKKARKGGLYFKLLDLVNAARKTRAIEIVGMCWMQGEADSRSEEMAAAYKTNLEAFIAKARADFESPSMIFVCGRVNTPDTPYAFTSVVRKAQESCASDNYGFIDCDALPKVKDNIHYTTQGICTMGESFAAKVNGLIDSK